jgi:hypothetical protein
MARVRSVLAESFGAQQRILACSFQKPHSALPIGALQKANETLRLKQPSRLFVETDIRKSPQEQTQFLRGALGTANQLGGDMLNGEG